MSTRPCEYCGGAPGGCDFCGGTGVLVTPPIIPVTSHRQDEYLVAWEGPDSMGARQFAERDVALAFYDAQREQGATTMAFQQRTHWTTPWADAQPDWQEEPR